MKPHALPVTFRLLMASVLLATYWVGLIAAAAAPLSESKTVLEIDFNAPSTPISPILHGLMTEEINYSYDGGLYAELIRNRAFLDDPRNEPVHWSVVKQSGVDGSILVVATSPLTD